jgi:hypothetical protein
MSTRSPVITALACESYFITKLGLLIGDEKWLKKNPISFDVAVDVVYDQFIKVFKRVSKLYLKRLGVASTTISVTRNSVRLIIKDPRLSTYYLGGHPRASLAPMYNRVRDFCANTRVLGYSTGIYPHGTARPVGKVLLPVVYFSSAPYQLPRTRPELKLNRTRTYFESIIMIGIFFKMVRDYHEAETAAFNEDLAYINNQGDTGLSSGFKYTEVEALSSWVKLIDATTPESPVERLTRELYKLIGDPINT